MISVIVPVYNCVDYVARCIHSIMAQTYPDLEIICIDDGSSDGSGELLDALALEDKRLRVVHQANAGASAARNAGIDLATGDFITFVDSDDAIEPDMYETLLPFFSDESVDIVHCGYNRIRPDGTVKKVNGTGKIVNQNKYEASDCLLRGSLFVGSMWNKLYRSQLFENVRLDTALAINEDVLANAELFCNANKLVFWDVCKYQFYERIGSVTTATKQKKKLCDCMDAAEKMYDMFRCTPAAAAAEERLINARIGLFRWYIMHSTKESNLSRKQLAGYIDDSLKKRKDISSRQRLNYKLMRHMPHLYRLLYSVYDKVRIPNWDVISEE